MSRSQRNCSPISCPDTSRVLRGTPGSEGTRWQFACNLQDRLEVIYGDADVRHVLRLVQQSRTYRDLIRHYSNDSML